MRNVLASARAVVIRGLAVVAVLVTYAVGTIGTQVATTVGVSTLALTTSATPASAWWRRGWGWRGYGWRRPIQPPDRSPRWPHRAECLAFEVAKIVTGVARCTALP